MREVKPEGAHINRDKVYGTKAGEIEVGSAHWYTWLEEEEGRELYFAARAECGIMRGASGGASGRTGMWLAG